jgi:hypothetical protein
VGNRMCPSETLGMVVKFGVSLDVPRWEIGSGGDIGSCGEIGWVMERVQV